MSGPGPERVKALASLLRSQNRELTSRVAGDSMGATLPAGTEIRIQLARVDQVGPGDVVAFISGRYLVVHRIVARAARGAGRGHWITRGDAQILPDPPVAPDELLGPVLVATTAGTAETFAAPPPLPRVGWLGRATLAATRALMALSVTAARLWIVVLVRLCAPFRKRPTAVPVELPDPEPGLPPADRLR